MINVTIADRTYSFEGYDPQTGLTLLGQESLNVRYFFQRLIEEGVDWDIDYSRATEEELAWWGHAETVALFARATYYGRAIFFQGKAYTNPEAFAKALSAVSRSFVIVDEDEHGVYVEANVAEDRH